MSDATVLLLTHCAAHNSASVCLALPSHLQAVLGGNSSPSKDDITSILGSGKRALYLPRAGGFCMLLFSRHPSSKRSSGQAGGEYVVAAHRWAS
jgi:hypothetical protein